MQNLSDLQVLRVVADAGSLTVAAERLGVSQSTVSRRLARLEAGFDARLVQRGRGGATVTPAGQEVVRFAGLVLDAYDAVVERLAGRRQQHSGLVRLATSTAPATVLPELLAGIAAEQPGLRFDVSVGDSADVEAALLSGSAAVGLSGRNSQHPALEHRRIAADEVVLVVPTRHPFSRRRRVAAVELMAERFVLREGGSATQRLLADHLKDQGHDLAQVACAAVVHNGSALLDAVRAGLGIGVSSELNLAQQGEDLVAVRLAEAPLSRSLWLVLPRDRERAPHRDAFVEHVERWFSGRSLLPTARARQTASGSR